VIWLISAIVFLQSELEGYRWKSRVLLQFGDPPKFTAKTSAAFKERDLVVLHADTPKFRKAFQVTAPFALILIGKDGSEKARWLTQVNPQTIIDLVDSMPMRKSEMRERNK
jgi:hypothetical protein